MTEFMNSDEIKKISEQVAQRAALAKSIKADQTAEDLKEAFNSRELAPEAPERINAAIRDAAERGEHELLVLRFPAVYCNDRGRRINNFEPDWPDSLEGFAKTAFEFYVTELRPLGFTMRAEIMNFPGGMMGDVGMYLKW